MQANKKVKFNKNGHLGKLLQKLQKLNRKKVKIGFFREQGLHPSGLHYTELMRLHEYGTEQFPSRPVLGGIERSYTLVAEMRRDSFKKLLASWMNQFVHVDSYSHDKLLDRVGTWGVHYAYQIFGSEYLTLTYNPTPLIDTGDLSNNLAWKVSLRGTVHTL